MGSGCWIKACLEQLLPAGSEADPKKESGVQKHYVYPHRQDSEQLQGHHPYYSLWNGFSCPFCSAVALGMRLRQETKF